MRLSFVKRILVKASVLACVSASAFLCACHGSKGLPEFEVPESFDETHNYEITFWAKNDTNKTQSNIYKNAIADFEKLYPNIKVNIRLYTDYGRIYNDVITNISTSTTPNVCITYPDHIATYMSGINIVVPLDELMDDERYGLAGADVKFSSPAKGEVIERFLDECILDGEHYAIPFMRSSEALYINADLVRSLGYDIPDVPTWDYVWEVSEAAMAKDPDGTFAVNGQKVMIPFIYKSTDNMMISMLRQCGGGYSTPEGDIEIFNDSTRDILMTVSHHARTGAFSTFKISSYPGNFLNAGQCIFAVDSTAGSTWMGSGAPLSDIAPENMIEFETVVRPIPQYDPDDPHMISQGPSVCIFNKEDPGEVLASWLFAQYLLTDEVQNAYAMTEGYVPVTSHARESAEYKEYLSLAGADRDHYQVKMDATDLLLRSTDRTFVTPVFNGSASLRDAAGALIENVTKAERRGRTVDDAFIDNMFSEVASLYKLDAPLSGPMKKEALGPLPKASLYLIISLIVIWTGIAAITVIGYIRHKKDGSV
ncbi:MAG: ABC transporter substrate-binding protein [Lachnospiraceae bacterium]|nr:ABC transporter substrate-binding protein [Lachnospiraceae bacterium]